MPFSALEAGGLAVADQVAVPRGRGRGRGGPGVGAAAGEGEGAAGYPCSKGPSILHALIFDSRRHFVLSCLIQNSKNCYEMKSGFNFRSSRRKRVRTDDDTDRRTQRVSLYTLTNGQLAQERRDRERVAAVGAAEYRIGQTHRFSFSFLP